MWYNIYMDLLIHYIDKETLKTIRKETVDVPSLVEADTYMLKDFTYYPAEYKLGFFKDNHNIVRTLDPHSVAVKMMLKMESDLLPPPPARPSAE